MTTTIFLATGGTGGHIFPAISVAETLKQKGMKPVMITDHRGWKIINNSDASLTTRRIKAASPYAQTKAQRLINFGKLGIGFLQAFILMAWHRPAAIIGFGGYPSVAPVIVARILGRATMLHEQNAFFGRANRFLAPYATAIALSWKKTDNIPAKAATKTMQAGMPVRKAFGLIKAEDYEPSHNAPFHVLIVGGSLGAQVFDKTVPEAFSRLPQDLKRRIKVVHQVRKEQIDAVRQGYESAGIDADIWAFINDMPQQMKTAHLVICRAGASSVAELAASGRPSILVPFPDAMDDHQTLNAQTVVQAGGGWCIPENEMSAGSLAGRIASLIEDPTKMKAAAAAIGNLDNTDAAEIIVRRLESLINKGAA